MSQPTTETTAPAAPAAPSGAEAVPDVPVLPAAAPRPDPRPVATERQPLPAEGLVVLDASFILALLQRHPGATALAPVLARGVLTSVTAGEVYAKVATATAPPTATADLAAATSAAAGAASRGGPTDSHRIEGVLRAQGVRTVDLPSTAAHHFPTLRRIDAARRAEQRTRGERAATLSFADLCVLGYALEAGLPVLTGDRHWATLTAHGLTTPVHLYQHAE